MAKLVRQKTTRQVGPVGVVRMTGLRSQAEAWGETGRAADMLSAKFEDDLIEQSKRRANEELASRLNDPETNLHNAIIENAKGDKMFVADSNGVPTEVPPHLQQKKLLEENMFTGAYTKEMNRLLRQHNKNLAISDISSYLEGQYTDQDTLGKYNPSQFNDVATSYVKSRVDAVDPSIQAEVFNYGVAAQTKFFNSLYQKSQRDIRDKNIASQSQKLKTDLVNFRDDVANNVLPFESNVGAQQNLLSIATDALGLSRTLNEDDIAIGKRLAGLNAISMNGQIQGMVLGLGNDADGFTPEDNVQMAEMLDGLISGQQLVTGIVLNKETGAAEIKQVPIGQLVPDLADRKSMFGDLGSVIKAKRDFWKDKEDLYEMQQTAVLSGYKAELYMAAANGDIEGIQRVQRDIEAWQDALVGNKATDLKQKASYAILWGKSQLADEYKSLIDEGYAKGLASMNDEMLRSLNDAELRTYTTEHQLDNAEYQQALKDGGWKHVLADQKRKNASLKAILSTRGKETDAQKTVRESVINPDIDLVQTEATGKVLGNMVDVVAGGEYKPLDKSEGDPNWQRDWEIIGNTVRSTKGLPIQLRGRIANAFNSKDVKSIANAAALIVKAREAGVPEPNIEQALGSTTYKAINEVTKQLTTATVGPISDETLERATNYYDPRKAPVMKWDAEMLRESNKLIDAGHEDLGPLFFDKDPFPPLMKQDIRDRMKMVFEQNRASDPETAYKIATDEILKTRKMWGQSRYNVKDKWVKYPIEQVYGNLSPMQLDKVVRQSLLNETGNIITLGTGGEEINLMTSLAFPEPRISPLDPMIGDTGLGYMEKLVEAQKEYGEGYQLALRHNRGLGPNSVYDVWVKAADGSLQQIYDKDGNAVELDVGKTYGVFNQGQESLKIINAQIDDLETKFAYLDNYPLHLGSRAAVGYASDVRMDKMRQWQEAKEDIRALEDIKARLERATDLVDDEEIMAISGGNIIEAITKIRNEITSMPEDEYNRYDGLDREGKIQWMRDRGLLME